MKFPTTVVIGQKLSMCCSISMKAAILKSREQAKIDFLIRQSSGGENWLFLAKNSIKTKISPGILNRVEMKQR